MIQRDPFGVLPEGSLTPDDINDLSKLLMLKDIYIGRLQQRIVDQNAEISALQASSPAPPIDLPAVKTVSQKTAKA